MTPCGARQMSMFSRQLFKATQSVTGGRMAASGSISSVRGGTNTLIRLSRRFTGRCHGRGGEESVSVSEESDAGSPSLMRFSPQRHSSMSTSRSVLLIYEPSCDAQE
ncbi:unnamed protein product [Pleuronectes platessa]|uniref:Uncharacterized protein n=1 Tax=Pleuronectes platessa TaxID=8262 RepID=A0A9N7VZA1_PLEPL|nr:unnamed protein product [Pleuronectes platessa]